MLGHRQLSPGNFLRICRRRWTWVLVPALFGALAGLLLARLVPPKFTSEATVEENSRVVGMLMGAEPVSVRLAALQRQALTPERLDTLASRFGLYPAGPDSRAGAAAAQISRNILVSPSAAGFTVSFTAGDSRTAQQVCAELAAFLLQEDQKTLQRQVDQALAGTAVSLAASAPATTRSELSAARQDLDESTSRLAGFRRQHSAELAAATQHTAERKLAGDQEQLDAVDAALKTAFQQRTVLTESLFSRQPQAVESPRPAETPAIQALEQELAADQAQLVSLQARYTEDYPDVVKLKSDIEQLQKKIAEARKSGGAEKTPNATAMRDAAEFTRIQAQMNQLAVLIQQKTRDQARLEQDILEDRAQVDAAAIAGQQYRELVAQVASAQQLYARLRASSSDSQGADHSGPPSVDAARLVAPPSLPVRPSFPNPLLFTLWGAGAGLSVGLLGIVAGERKDKSLRTAGDIEHFLELPTLAVIPAAGTNDGGGNGNSGPRRDRTGHRGEKQEGVLADV
jgi:protein tyrosine kinase modulator